MKNDKVLHVEITSKTILFTIGVVLLLFFLRNITDLFLNLFIAFILMSALKPSVEWLAKHKVPRSIASIIVILTSLGVLLTTLYFALPPLVTQSVEFIIYISRELFATIQKLDQQITVSDFLNFPTLTQQLPNLTNIISRFLFAIFGNLFNVLTIFFFTLYFLLGINQLDSFAKRFFNSRQASFFIETLRSVERQLGMWMRAELFLMLIIGVLSYIGLLILGVDYALPLAVIAGLLEIFPIVGPIVSAIPAFFVAATASGFLGLAVIVLYTVIQQLENNLIVPMVMKRAVGIPPLAVLLSLIIGEKLAGFAGVVLAVPFVAAGVIIFKEVFKYREENNNSNKA